MFGSSILKLLHGLVKPSLVVLMLFRGPVPGLGRLLIASLGGRVNGWRNSS